MKRFVGSLRPYRLLQLLAIAAILLLPQTPLWADGKKDDKKLEAVDIQVETLQDEAVIIDVLTPNTDDDDDDDGDDDDGDDDDDDKKGKGKKDKDDGKKGKGKKDKDDDLALDSFTQPDNGTVTDNDDGTLTYTPNAGYSGEDSFTYTIREGKKEKKGKGKKGKDDEKDKKHYATGTVTVTVIPVTVPNNDPVITSATSASAIEDVLFSYTATATDEDGDAVSFSFTGLPAWASAAGATVSGTPLQGDGDFTFGIHADDSNGGTDDATVSVTVRATNDAPVADGQSVSTDEDQAVAITLTGSDEDGDALTFATTSPANGSLSGSGANLTYTPNGDYNGDDSFTFTVNDGTVNSAAATVAITVNAVNDVPVANNDEYTVPEDSDPVVLDVLANDFDADGDNLTIQPVKQANGIVHIVGDGTLTYEPTPNFSGIDEFIYAISDGIISEPVEATVRVNVTGENDAPVITSATTASATEDVLFSYTATATDIDGDAITFSFTGLPAWASFSGATVSGTPGEGDGNFTFSITASDGNGGTDNANVSVTVTAVNDAPVITSATTAAATEDVPFSYTATATDDDGDAITFSFSGLPAWASASGGTVSGTPLEGDGNFTFSITASDGNGGTDNASVSVTVTAVNDAPVITSATTASATEDVPFSYTATATDEDGDDVNLSITGVLPTWASASGATVSGTPLEGDGNFTFGIAASDGNGGTDNASVSVTVTAVNDAPVITSATTATATEDVPFSYTATATDDDGDAVSFSFSGLPAWASASGATVSGTPLEGDGNFTFSITASDGNGGTDDATVTVSVTAVNDAPVITSATTASATEDVPFSYTATATDDDGDAITFSFSGLPAWASASGGTVSGSPVEGAGDFTFGITASDGNGGTDNASVSVTVTAVNDAPVITSATTASATEDVPFSYTATATDPEGDAVSFSFSGLPAWASASGATVSGTPGEGDGNFTFSITASDGNGGTDDATVTVSVTAVNDAPVITSATTASATEDVPFSYTATATDAEGDAVSFSFSGLPAWASASGATVSGTPGEGDGNFTFSITASDGNGGTDNASVSVTVTSVNDAPVITSATTASATEDVPFSYTATATDEDGDDVNFSITGVLPAWASASGATVSGTPGEGDGNFTFSITASDGNGGTDNASVSVTVEAINDAPVADGQAVETDEDTALLVTLSGSDPEGDPLTYSFGQPGNGTLSGSAPNLTYTPVENFNGADAFVFTVSDGSLTSQPVAVRITVKPVNDAPVITSATTASATEDVPFSYTATAEDLEGDDIFFTITGLPTWASLSGTTVSGTPGEGDGDFSFNVSVRDRSRATADITVNVTVTGVNDPPVANAQSLETDEDTAILVTLSGSDPDGDPLTYTFAQPANGILSGSAPNLTYTPNENYNGLQRFTFTVSDGQATSAPALVSITVNAVNDAPVITSATTASATEDVAFSYTATATDPDGDAVSFSFSGLPAWLSASGARISGTPREGDGDFSFGVSAGDGNGGNGNMTVVVAIATINDDPVANAQTVTIGQDESVAIILTASDINAGDELTFSVTVGPQYGTLQGAAPNLTYTPSAGFSGSDAFTFAVSDGNGGAASAQVTIYVNVNEVAVSEEVNEDGGTVSWDTDGTGESVASISIPGGALDFGVTVEISLYSAPPEGAELAGPLFYFGPSGLQFSEPVTITVPYDPDDIPDGVSESDLAVVRYDEGDGSWTALLPSTVDTDNHTISAQTDHFSGFGAGIPEGTNHSPIITEQLPAAAIDEDESFAVVVTNLSSYFRDADALDVLTYIVTSLDTGVDTVFISDGNLIAIPSENFFGTVRIQVAASDGKAFVIAELTLTINPVNDAPELVTIADLSLVEDTEVWIPLRASDIEGDLITFEAESDTSAVVQQVFGDTTLLLVPLPNWVGTANITVTATDALGASESSDFNVSFTASNDPPSAFSLLEPVDAYEVKVTPELVGLSLAFSWEASTDADGDPIRYVFLLEDEQSTYLLRDTVVTGIEVPYADMVAIMDDLGVNNLSLWWSILAVSGADSVEAVNGPFEIKITKSLAVETGSHVPQMFALHQNYPNPFNPVTTLRYEMPAHTRVNITIYDLRGRKVIELVDGFMHAGYNKVIWNSADAMGRPVSSGIYFARMVTPEYTHTIKMSLIK